MNASDKPSVDGLMRLRFFRDLTISERFKILSVFGVVPEGVTIDEMNHSIERRLFDVAVERLAALAGPLEQPQEPTSNQANLAQASGGEDLQTALPRWIPVDERMPEDGEQVLCGSDTDGWVLQGWYDAERRGWWELNTHWTDAYEGQLYPSHWAPMPLPPGESAGAVPSDKPAASS